MAEPHRASDTLPLPPEENANRRALETKYRISEIAMALFLQEGYESVTVESVAAAAHVSRRTVFRHFSGKDELPFPDHSERLALLRRNLWNSALDDDPVEVVIAATEASLRAFLSRPDLVLRRFHLTRVVPQLRDREVIEHERYVRLTREFLRRRLPENTPPFHAVALAALIDAIHRSALGNYARSGREYDALAELHSGMEWVRQLLHHASEPRHSMMLAVLSDTPEVRRALLALRDAAEDEL